MASSFLGLAITLTLHTGQTLRGKVAAIEPETGRLTIESNAGVRKTLARDEIKDLQLSGSGQGGADPASVPAHFAAPLAPTAPSSDAVEGAAAAAPSASSFPPPPKAPKGKSKGPGSTNAAPLAQSLVSGGGATSSDAPASSSSPPLSAAQAKALRAGNSSTPPPGAKGRGSKGKGAKGAVHHEQQQSDPAAEISEDFDFEAGLRSFDKKSVWEEIRASSKTDPSQLLVSHNLRSASPAMHASNGLERGGGAPTGRGRQGHARHPQDKLRNDENVLSPSPEREPVEAVAASSNELEGELAKLQARYAVLQALSGIELDVVPSAAPGESRYVATIWESVGAAKKAHSLLASAKVKGVDPSAAASKGALRFEVAASISAPSTIKSLRYLGPRLANPGGSDEALVQKLPEHCRKPASAVGSGTGTADDDDDEVYQGIGLRAESAGVFVKRLKDAIAVASASGAQ